MQDLQGVVQPTELPVGAGMTRRLLSASVILFGSSFAASLVGHAHTFKVEKFDIKRSTMKVSAR